MDTKKNTVSKEHQETLIRLKTNARISHIRVAAPKECELGQSIQGVYNKDAVPSLPIEGCSRPGGCICRYEPVIRELFP